METIYLPNLLLIAGTGRNSGKTTLACSIIEKFSKTHNIIAVKISSHFHKNVQCERIILNSSNLYLAEETDTSTSKDSSLMLAAGAKKSYFVMSSDDQLDNAMQTILSLSEKKDFFICESGGLRKWITPGLFFMMNHKDNTTIKANTLYLRELCDKWITFGNNTMDFNINTIGISDNRWLLKKTNT